MTLSQIIASARDNNFTTSIECGELHVIGHGPEFIVWRADVIDNGANYLGKLTTRNGGYPFGTPVHAHDSVLRFGNPIPA